MDLEYFLVSFDTLMKSILLVKKNLFNLSLIELLVSLSISINPSMVTLQLLNQQLCVLTCKISRK